MGEIRTDWSKIPVPMELFVKFNNVKFFDDIHKYFVNGKNFISVTTKLHKFKEEFDTEFWSLKKMDELGLTQDEVKLYWKALNIKSQIKGTAVHNYAELLYNNKIYKYDDELAMKKLGKENLEILDRMGVTRIGEEFETVKKFVDNFYRDTYEKLIPIKTEFVVFDIEWELAGMMDIIFWNVKHQCFQIWDWKTNKELNMVAKYSGMKLKSIVSDLDECEFELYSLQLSAYKRIIERNTSIKLGDSYIVWFNEVNDNYKIIKCNDYSSEINMIMSKDF
jgi:hypothetical protein